MTHSTALRIDVAELRQVPLKFDLDEEPSRLDLTGEALEFIGRVGGNLAWRWVDERVVAMGRLTATVRTPCVRCLRDVETQIDVEARLVFSDEPIRRTEVVEISLDDEGVTHYRGGYIDPSEDIRALLMLEAPDHAVCSDDCKGLCPDCGADLNDGACGCAAKEPESASGWKAQLNELRNDLD